MRITSDLLGSSKQSRSKRNNNQRTVNMYPEFGGSKTPIALYRTPGLTTVGSIGNGPCTSNGEVFNGKLYFSSGVEVYAIDTAEAVTLIGIMLPGGGRVTMESSQNYLVLVDGLNGYTYDGTVFAKITDASFPSTTTHIDVMNGRWLAIDPDTGNFFMSAIDDPTTWSALDFANAEAQPDKLRALKVINDVLYLLGEYTAEGWYFSGNADFPFSPIQGGVSNVGISAKYSLASNDDVMLYVGETKEGGVAVVKQVGTNSQIISDVNINWQLDSISNTSDAEGSIYYQAGHIFYILTFPTDKRTFCYDLMAPDEFSWTERESFNLGRWRVSGIGYFNNKVYCGNYLNGDLYALDFNNFQENGEVLKWMRITPPIHQNYNELTFWELVIDIAGGQDSSVDPAMMMRYTDDGGYSWSDELRANLGKTGERSTKAFWTQLGNSYERTFEITGTDNVNVELLGSYIDVELSDV